MAGTERGAVAAAFALAACGAGSSGVPAEGASLCRLRADANAAAGDTPPSCARVGPGWASPISRAEADAVRVESAARPAAAAAIGRVAVDIKARAIAACLGAAAGIPASAAVGRIGLNIPARTTATCLAASARGIAGAAVLVVRRKIDALLAALVLPVLAAALPMLAAFATGAVAAILALVALLADLLALRCRVTRCPEDRRQGGEEQGEGIAAWQP